MVEIIPAIMPRTFDDLARDAARVAGLVPLAQIDVIDGLFAPNPTWPYVPKTGMEELSRIAREDDTLPDWETLEYEIDLMVKEPERIVDAWVMAGARRLIIHIESTEDFSRVLKALEGRYAKRGDELSSFGVELGLALSIGTPLERIDPYLDHLSFVQLMGIARIGKQGEPLDERIYARVTALKEKYPDLILSIDGGVRKENAPQLIAAGADRLVAGSAIFGSSDLEEAIRALRT